MSPGEMSLREKSLAEMRPGETSLGETSYLPNVGILVHLIAESEIAALEFKLIGHVLDRCLKILLN